MRPNVSILLAMFCVFVTLTSAKGQQLDVYLATSHEFKSEAEAEYYQLKHTGMEVPESLQLEVFGGRSQETSSRQGGDTPSEAYPITEFPFNDTGTTSGYAGDVGPYDNSYVTCYWDGYFSTTNTGLGQDVFYSFTLAEETTLQISLCGSSFDTSIGVFENVDGALGTLVAGNDDFCSLQSQTLCTFSPGDYFLAVDGWGSSSGDYTLEIRDDIEDPCVVYNENINEALFPGIVTGTTVDGTDIDGNGFGDVGYSFDVNYAGVYSFSACAPQTERNVILAVYNSSPCSGGAVVAQSTEATCYEGGAINPGQITDLVLDCGSYHLVVLSGIDGEGAFLVEVQRDCDSYPTIASVSPPTILTGTTADGVDIYWGPGPDVGYNIEAQVDGYYNFDACFDGSTYSLTLSLFTDHPCFGGTLIQEQAYTPCDEVVGAARMMAVWLNAGNYHLLVGDDEAGVGAYEILFQELPPEPLHSEDFNHSGVIPTDWIIESQSRSTPWTPFQESGEDWAMESNHTAFEATFDEWLKSPVYDLTWWENVEAGFTNSYIHANSEAAFRVSTNGGLSWSTVQAWTASTNETILLDVSNWVDGESNVRFAFRFRSDFITDGPSWRIDDFFLNGTPNAPVASTPVPEQPPAVWTSGTGTIGCTWMQPLEVEGDSLQVRIDYNGDGDYLDGAEEDWLDLPMQADAASIDVTHLATFGNNGLLKFEFRAKSVGGAWGYSGTAGIEGIADDWFVLINADLEPPTFANYIPSGQPDPVWLPDLTTSVGVQVTDDASVDASTIQMRVDTNADGAFTGPEEAWQTLSGYIDGSLVDVLEEVNFVGDGEYIAQFQAADLAGNQASSDTLRIRIDATAPPLALTGSGNTSLNLAFSATADENFQRYELAVSTDSLVDETDLLWSDAQDPGLGSISTNQTTVTGLQPAMRHWLALRAIDLAGNTSSWSNTVSGITEGAPPLAVSDLTATKTPEGVVLSWTPPVEDIYGGSPVVIQDYDVHASEDPHFEPNPDTFLGSTTSPNYLIPLSRTSNVLVFYRVVVNGAGPGTLPHGLLAIPAQQFEMGQAGVFGAEPVHQVTLTNDFFIGRTEVTTADYITALQWAYDSGYITIQSGNPFQHGVRLVYMSGGGSEIGFADGLFIPLEAQYHDYWGFEGPYDPANHPVKNVSWYGAVCYCDWLSEMEGLEPTYNGNWAANPYPSSSYRLPTEAEWELSARTTEGNTYPWGETNPSSQLANFGYNVGWTTEVGSYPDGSNQFGMQDLAGNVLEWCHDWLQPHSADPVVDPVGATTGSQRVIKGGSFVHDANHLASAYHIGLEPQDEEHMIGFRLCRTPLE